VSAVAAISGAWAFTAVRLVAFKLLFGWLGARNARDLPLARRVSAMATGAIAVEMTLHGLKPQVGSRFEFRSS